MKSIFDAVLVAVEMKTEGDSVSPLKAHGLAARSGPEVHAERLRCGQEWRTISPGVSKGSAVITEVVPENRKEKGATRP